MKKHCLLLLIALLCLAMLLPLVACAKDTPPEPDVTKAPADDAGSDAGSGTGPADETPARTWNDLPKTDYNNEKLLILGRNSGVWSSADLAVDADQLTNKLSSAVYSRNTSVELRHGIQIVSNNLEDGPLQTMIEQQVLNGENTFDLYDLPIYIWGKTLQKGYLTNLLGVQLLDLEESWWDTSFVESMTMYEQLYGAVGDATYIDKLATWSVIFNVDMLAQYGIEKNPYDLVDDNAWTIEEMLTMAEAVNTNNGDPQIKAEEGDVYGIVGEVYNILVFMQGSGMQIAEFDEDHGIVVNLYEKSERANNIFTTVYDLVADSTLTFNATTWPTDDRHARSRSFFRSQQALFMVAGVNNIVNYFSEFEHDYGILPIPKETSDQARYYCGISNYGFLVFCIPTNARNVEMSAMVLQAMTCRGQTTVRPVLYDDILKYGASRDPDSARMLDVIYSSRVYDIAIAFHMTDATNAVTTLVSKFKKDEFVSKMKDVEGAVNESIEKLIVFYEKQLTGGAE